MAETFKAVVVDQRDGGQVAEVREVARGDLPEGDVLVRVAYSGLNYKDGLAVTGKGKVIRAFPMVPGIDFAGTVEESGAAEYTPGDRVLLTGWGVGERHWGGFAQLARVPAGWLVPIPEAFDLREAMVVGTAGFTAMLALMALEEHGLRPDALEGHEVLVTGASGGVGGMAVALLAHAGYPVAAETGRTEAHGYLHELGAASIVARATLEEPGGPLGSARWSGAIDTVGGAILAGVLRTLAHGTSVAACGNAGGLAVSTSVAPFILRGVNLLGIDSLPTPLERRKVAWDRLARELPRAALGRILDRVVPLGEVPALAEDILAGRVRGRVIIDVNA
ncbi:MAG TPA: MDR family oxidoreductase [Ktedonobacterales bacterium]|jgi:acrylyl-CoA reductase (NADPH)